jgi:ATP-binding cassette subfamily B protein
MMFGLFDDSPPERRFLAPEVVQTSAMDCGPAALKSLLAGFDIRVSYGRLREACQTSVDGTSIDTLEDIAVQLGLDAAQIMVPADHLLLPAAQVLPALTVVRLPNGLTHFVVVWRLHGAFAQIMDPATGRHWQRCKTFSNSLYQHSHVLPADMWHEWALSDSFTLPLEARMVALEIKQRRRQYLLMLATNQADWRGIASLDAAVRMSQALHNAGGIDAGREAETIVETLYQRALADRDAIPPNYWTTFPHPEDDKALLFRGAVLIQVAGGGENSEQTSSSETTSEALEAVEEAEEAAPLAPELAAALAEANAKPERDIFRALKADGLLTPGMIAIALLFAALGVTLEALLLRGLLVMGEHLETLPERITALEALIGFFILLVVLEVAIFAGLVRTGRNLEIRLRLALLEKIPKLSDRYFHSRLTSDMTQRAYDLRLLRNLPLLASNFLRTACQIILTLAALIWLNPAGMVAALLAATVSIALPILGQTIMNEQNLRFMIHSGALSRFYLDALHGLTPIRSHSAAPALRAEHESLLLDWIYTGFDFARSQITVQTISAFTGTAFAVWLLFNYLDNGGEASGILVMLYWAFNLPVLSNAMANAAEQYPLQRNRVLRLLEPLNAAEEADIRYAEATPAPDDMPDSHFDATGVVLHEVTVQAGGQSILSAINLTIQGGEHIAVVGASGAGKSTLVGLLLGWHRPVAGSVWVDGKLLEGEHLAAMRRQTAWLDPAVQIWNRSLEANLRYGNDNPQAALGMVLAQADLLDILEQLPDGLNTPLGEGGSLLSGGEGQRVRLGRAMLRDNVRLVILDEPFRGLARSQRAELLHRARAYWRDATLIFISHDVGDTQDFERVLVIDNGQVLEDAKPADLLTRDSRYRDLLEAERDIRNTLWESADWRRLVLADGKLEER